MKKLIAGPQIQICDECLELCVQVLDEEACGQQRRAYHVELLLATLRSRGTHVPHAVATPMLRGLIALAGDDATTLRQVYAAAIQVDDHRTAVVALVAIPHDQRTTTDRLNHAGGFDPHGARGGCRWGTGEDRRTSCRPTIRCPTRCIVPTPSSTRARSPPTAPDSTATSRVGSRRG